MADNFIIRQLSVEDGKAFIKCYNEGFSKENKKDGFSSQNLEYFNWQYINNPGGGFRGVGAFHKDKLVAVYVVTLGNFMVDNERVIGAQSMDTLTLPEARRKGLFKKLCGLTYRELKEEGLVNFTYGFPNQNSTHGFVKYHGWRLIDPIPFVMRLLNTSYLKKKVMLPVIPGIAIAPYHTFFERKTNCRVQYVKILPNDVNQVWEGFRKTFKVGLVRDLEYLKWRFSRPGVDYLFFEARQDNGQLSGLGVMRMLEKRNERLAYIMELMTRENDPGIVSRLIHGMLTRAVQERVDAVAARSMPGHPYRRVYMLHGFHPLPKIIRPLKSHFGYVTHTPDFRTVLANRGSWYISYADDDTL